MWPGSAFGTRVNTRYTNFEHHDSTHDGRTRSPVWEGPPEEKPKPFLKTALQPNRRRGTFSPRWAAGRLHVQMNFPGATNVERSAFSPGRAANKLPISRLGGYCPGVVNATARSFFSYAWTTKSTVVTHTDCPAIIRADQGGTQTWAGQSQKIGVFTQ